MFFKTFLRILQWLQRVFHFKIFCCILLDTFKNGILSLMWLFLSHCLLSHNKICLVFPHFLTVWPWLLSFPRRTRDPVDDTHAAYAQKLRALMAYYNSNLFVFLLHLSSFLESFPSLNSRSAALRYTLPNCWRVSIPSTWLAKALILNLINSRNNSSCPSSHGQGAGGLTSGYFPSRYFALPVFFFSASHLENNLK